MRKWFKNKPPEVQPLWPTQKLEEWYALAKTIYGKDLACDAAEMQVLLRALTNDMRITMVEQTRVDRDTGWEEVDLALSDYVANLEAVLPYLSGNDSQATFMQIDKGLRRSLRVIRVIMCQLYYDANMCNQLLMRNDVEPQHMLPYLNLGTA